MTKVIEKKLENFSDRLNYALSTLNITQAELARAVGTSPQVINHLCKSASKKSGYAGDIADALNVSLEWLLYGAGPMRYEDDPILRSIKQQKHVAIINWSDIGNLISGKYRPTTTSHDKWLLTRAPVSDASFALVMNDNAMSPIFQRGSIVVSNPDSKPQDKYPVLAHIALSDEYLVRTLNSEDNTLNPPYEIGYTKIPLQKDDKIIGVVAEARWYLSES